MDVESTRAHIEGPAPRFPGSVTFATCVADPEKYGRCRASLDLLDRAGFEIAVDPVDNAGNRRSCPEALNLAWGRAGTDLLVFCHEDVVFPPDWLAALRRSLEALEGLDPPWAVAGPIGRAGKRFLGHCAGPDGTYRRFGPLPAPVDTLDEMCLVVPRDLPIRFDESLGGFHLYGADLCIQAAEAGRGSYAIDAPCRHDSTVRHRPPEYHAIKRKLQAKWRFGRRRVGRSVGTTCGRIRFGLFEGWI
jgi:hypothetical protein